MKNSFLTDEFGRLNRLNFAGEEVPMRTDGYAQDVFISEGGLNVPLNVLGSGGNFSGRYNGVRLDKQLAFSGDTFVVNLSLTAENEDKDFDRLFFRLGIDAYMESYPEWDKLFFPTFLRAEKTHFWGYFSRTDGKLLAICSPDEIVSWQMEYSRVNYDPRNFDDPGHRIYTCSLDLFNKRVQPSRHPKNKPLKKGETRKVSIHFKLCDTLKDMNEFFSDTLGIRLTTAKKWTLEKGEKIDLTERNGSYQLMREGKAVNMQDPLEKTGMYTLINTVGARQSESYFFVRDTVSDYLKKGAEATQRYAAFPSTHCETYYSLYGALCYAAFEDTANIQQTLKSLDDLLTVLLDGGTELVAAADPGRIQNYAVLVSILCLAYTASKQQHYLSMAEKLADNLLRSQKADGAYYSKGVHYTCVIYPLKSLLELCEVESAAGRLTQHAKYYDSTKRAAENLLRLEENIGTEGEHTFEDGMISCEALQLADFALTRIGDDRAAYTRLAADILDKHRCLELNHAPDARMRGATVRHWEAHYDILTSRNMITAPHGWTSWKTYAAYYLYLLTHELRYLTDCFDTLGACLQCVNHKTGELRWAFVVDPSITTRVFVPDPDNGGVLEERTFGECYLPMISDWWQADKTKVTLGYGDPRIGLINGRAKGGCCNHDVFEHFKCLYEVGMQAFVHQTEDGFVTYNCRVEAGEVILNDSNLKKVRIWLEKDADLCVFGENRALCAGAHEVVKTDTPNQSRVAVIA